MELNGGFTVNTTLNANALSYAPMGQRGAAFTNHPLTSADAWPQQGWPNAVNSGVNGHVAAFLGQSVYSPFPAIAHQQSWLDAETREAYLEATVEQDIAWQIAINRKARGLSQEDLAKKCGTKQSGIARIEDPNYGKHSIRMLVKVAHAFECALRIQLIPYSRLAEEIQDTSPEALTVKSFSEEKYLIPPQGEHQHG
jgi:transcriptional regulator with XRE-family HTH domain